MANIQQKTVGRSTLLLTTDLLPEITVEMFDIAYWQAQDKVIGQASGRGTTFFFRENQHEYVLRHYRRGGLIGKLIADQYLYTGVTQTRAYREMHLLDYMCAQNLNVPKPVAARIARQGLTYCADIILQKIPQATDVFSLLLSKTLEPSIWLGIGQAIRQLHDHQIYHHDLNIHNIMLDGHDKVWIIDFDKCGIREGESWKNDNLQRLLRSLQKESARQARFTWTLQDWQHLLLGYQPV